MKALLHKELKLALHPTAPIFLLLSALFLVPNYPYYVTFFYTTLALFFICLQGRENQDPLYSVLLPTSPKTVVAARFLLAVGLELLQILCAVPFALLRGALMPEGNLVGMDANIALFGIAFLMLGAFNYVFFTGYYKNVSRVGAPFIGGSAMFFLLIALAETAAHIVPFVRDRLDTPDPLFLPEKLAVLAVGLLAFAVLTLAAYRRSAARFEAQDL